MSQWAKFFNTPILYATPVCFTIVSKGNLCNASIVSQHFKPLNGSKSVNFCNVRNRNVNIINSVSHHTELLGISKSDCSCNVSKPVICKSSNKSVCKIINNPQIFSPVHESVVVNHSKRDNKRSFNVSSHKHGVAKSLMEGIF